MPKTVAFIFARGGSKGLPGKNIKEFDGKPLIAHSIEFALASPHIDDVVISTDCEKIAEVAKTAGAKVPFMRPAELSGDTAPESMAWKHAAGFYQENIAPFDNFVSLPAVSPLRKQEDLEKVLSTLQEGGSDFVLTATLSDGNPYFNLIESNDQNFFELSKSSRSYRRQDIKKVFKIIPMIYACRVETVFKFDHLFAGKVAMVEVPAERAVDIDTPEDFDYLQYLLETKGSHLNA